MSEKKPIKCYPVPPGANVGVCRCGKRQVWGVTDSGARCPLSIDHPEVVRDEKGRVVAAPSHYVDCANAKDFSGRGRKKAGGG